VKLPDIAWGKEVLAGRYTLGGDKEAWNSFDKREVHIAQPFRLARYPVTYAQFQCFIDAPDFGDGRWWANMPDNARELGEQAFPYANHPRERVSWYQAVAFCRWLTARLHAGTLPVAGISGDARQYVITLPHEYEWEAAARYPGPRFYPWGSDFDAEKANTSEGNIVSTIAVGIYPAGRQPELDLYDLSGNVWEWCRNKYDNPDDDRVDAGGTRRALRGGSWNGFRDGARATARSGNYPGDRNDASGFRVAVVHRLSSQ
jgi:formylglycine-generating enzyme required for sulfatase activity